MIFTACATIAAPQSITIGERAPAVLLVISPKETPFATPTSAFLAIAGELLAHRTRLELLSIERAGADTSLLETCSARDRLSCWLRAATASTHARYVFVLAAHARDEHTERLTLLAFDAVRARSELDSTRTGDDLENALYALAIATTPRDTPAGDNRALRTFFEHALLVELRAAFKDRPDFTAFGDARVELPPEPLTLAIDTGPPHETGGGTILLRELAPGSHTLAIARAAQVIARETFTIEPARTTTITGLVAAPAPVASAPIRTGARIAAAALVIAGSAVTAYALATRSDVRSACLVRAATATALCADPGEPTVSRAPSEAPSVEPAAINPSGVLVLPLGLAILTTGAALGGATFVLDGSDLDGPPLWATIAIAIAAGAAVYTAGVLADPR